MTFDIDKTIVSLIHKDKNKRYYNWGEYFNEVCNLAESIKQSNQRIDYIIAVSRGGLIVGDLISRMLGIKYGIVKMSTYDDQTNCQDKTKLTDIKSIIDPQLCVGNVLVIDDLVDSGETLKAVCQYIKDNYESRNVYSGVLWERVKEVQIHTSDFCCNRIKDCDWKWIVQPNEMYQDLLI